MARDLIFLIKEKTSLALPSLNRLFIRTLTSIWNLLTGKGKTAPTMKRQDQLHNRNREADSPKTLTFSRTDAV